MPIVELKAENVKRLKAVRIRPDGSLVQITGKNGAGKSSVLDSIAMALGGKGQIPDQPVRQGQRQAEIVVDLGDMVVTRTWTRTGTTTLLVQGKDGPMKSPQAVLDKLVGDLTFDPCGFERMKSAEQLAIVKKVAGLDFAEADARRQRLYDERTQLNRDAKAIQAQADGMVVDETAPNEEWNLSALLVQQAQAHEAIKANEQLRRDVVQLSEETARAIQSVEAAEKALSEAKARYADIDNRRKLASKTAEVLTDPDISALNKTITDSEQINAKVRAKKTKAAKIAEALAVATKAEELTKQIDGIDQIKSDALASAKLPIPGLAWDELGVTVEGVPFEQCSASQRLRVSVAMALALQPALKIMLVREGSLLDTESLALLGKIAEESGAQVWLERVTDGEPVGIVIEDGEVKHAD